MAYSLGLTLYNLSNRRQTGPVLARPPRPDGRLVWLHAPVPEALRDRYEVSFSTLREALARLAAESLVISEGQRGFVVAPVSVDDLLDLTNARVLLETRRNSLTIPSSAVQRGPQGLFTWVVTPEGNAEMLAVKTGPVSGNVTIVETAISDKDDLFVGAVGSPQTIFKGADGARLANAKVGLGVVEIATDTKIDDENDWEQQSSVGRRDEMMAVQDLEVLDGEGAHLARQRRASLWHD